MPGGYLSQQSGGIRRRRSTRRRRARRLAIGLSICALVALGTWLVFSVVVARLQTSEANSAWGAADWGSESETSSLLRAFAVPQRPVYPYSIIPGGIQSADDLRRVSEHDQVVANHYADFDFHHARIIELSEPRLVYLSYRIGSKVFWTTKAVTLHKGEKLITDGKITARTRCANQVSALPQNVLPPPGEPLAELFEQPVSPLAVPDVVPGPVLATSAGPTPPWGPVPVGGPIFPPIGIPPSCTPTPKNGKPVPGKPKPCPPYNPPPPGIPEPGTIVLFVSGAAGIYLRLRKTAGKA